MRKCWDVLYDNVCFSRHPFWCVKYSVIKMNRYRWKKIYRQLFWRVHQKERFVSAATSTPCLNIFYSLTAEGLLVFQVRYMTDNCERTQYIQYSVKIFELDLSLCIILWCCTRTRCYKIRSLLGYLGKNRWKWRLLMIDSVRIPSYKHAEPCVTGKRVRDARCSTFKKTLFFCF